MRILESVRWSSTAALLAASGSVLAHPLHGAGDAMGAGFLHPLLGFDHLLAMVAVGLSAAQRGGHWLWGIPLAFVMAMLAGGLLGFLGLTVPLTEPLVAASVLILGLLVTLQVHFTWMGPALVAGFALFHGLAHAAELPPEAAAFAYAAGFTAATAALHAAGVALGMRLCQYKFSARFAGAPIALAGCWLLAGALA